MSSEQPQPVISMRGLGYTYHPQSPHPIVALEAVDLDVFAGEYLAVIGHNGSGKSTLAKLMNALLHPTAGGVWVLGHDTRERAHTREIRSNVGMVFQSPDNQIVSTVVEEDVAFGPENLGVPAQEIRLRVDWSLSVVGLEKERRREPHRLSAGQKQRLAIAGVMAMQPRVLVLDEATALLDPEGRRDLLAAIRDLNAGGVTIVAITHLMEEAAEASRVVVLEGGRIVMEGTPREVFSQVTALRQLQLDVPQVTELSYELHRRVPGFPPDLLQVGEAVREVEDSVRRRGAACGPGEPQADLHVRPAEDGRDPATAAAHAGGDPVLIPADEKAMADDRAGHGPVLIQVEGLIHTYLRGTPFETTALRGVSLEIRRGEVVGIIGRTGAGKSTLVQHLNGLLRPSATGQVRVDGIDTAGAGADLRRVRQKVGLAFQQPEQQLFERLVGDDVAYGPKKAGQPPAERRETVRWALESVGLDFDSFKDRYTFSLSGGEMRKVALAGVLALRPQVLILDESTAGLDPRSRKELLARLLELRRSQGLTLVFVSPSMEQVAELVDRVYLLDAGRIVAHGTTHELFSQPELLRAHGLGLPQVAEVAHQLRTRGVSMPRIPVTVAEGVEAICRILSC